MYTENNKHICSFCWLLCNCRLIKSCKLSEWDKPSWRVYSLSLPSRCCPPLHCTLTTPTVDTLPSPIPTALWTSAPPVWGPPMPGWPGPAQGSQQEWDHSRISPRILGEEGEFWVNHCTRLSRRTAKVNSLFDLLGNMPFSLPRAV